MAENDDNIIKEVRLEYPDFSSKKTENAAEEIAQSKTETTEDTLDDDFDFAPDEEYTATDPYGEPDLLSEEKDRAQQDYTPNQDTLINQAEASKKQNPDLLKKKNEGYTFDRQKVFIIVGVLAILGIFFLVFIMPLLNKDKVKKENELQQASKTWSNVEDWVEPPKEDEDEDTGPYNSSDVQENNEDDEEIPPLEIEKDSDDDNLTSSSSTRPQTNSNEQQKPLMRISLDDNGTDYERRYAGVQVKDSNQAQNGNPYAAYNGGNAYAYTPVTLSENMNRYMASMNGNTYEQQNNQSGKQKFFKDGGTGGQYQWNSEYTLWKGTIIPAVLETAINSDLPGVVIATVTTNVYSSLDGKHLLIPQGSKLYAEYSSSISYGQDRVQVVWNTLIRPDGLEVNLGGLNGVDPTGTAGYKGFKTNHPFEFVKALGLIACFSIVDTKVNNQIANSANAYTQNVLTDTYSEVKKLNNKIVERALDIQPTIRIASGRKVDLITNISMELPPLEPYPVTKKYKRER